MRLIKSRFVKWLKAKRPEEIVGQNRDCHACPIAQFYTEATGNDIVIYNNGAGYMGDRGYYNKCLPDWAQCFIFEVDGDSNGQISAARALAILEA